MKLHFASSLRILGPLLALATGFPLHAQQQFQGVCNRVKIQIEQELTTERIGFEAVLRVTNNDGQDPINQFSAALTFKDAATGEDAADKFFVQPPELQSINRIDGEGIISPTQTAVVTWFIIPKTGDNAPGGTDPRGKEYDIGCALSGHIRGDKIPEDVLFAVEDTITVKPEPQLAITYFQPRDVQGDDPFTPEVESPIPFTLGVFVKNDGYGLARKVKIDSKQPKIVENKNGLLLIARLLGARVQDSPLDETSLLVNLGDINPGEVKKGAWDMITSLSGEFVEFKASYRHAAELGGEETSVIKSLDAHFIARECLNDEPGRDDIMDFLADTDRDPNRIPDTLYETDGAVLPVNHQPQAEVSAPLSGGEATVSLVADREGWVYMRLDDPAQASYPIERVVRDDGKELHPRNVWTNIRYRRSDNFRLTFFNILDRVENGESYNYRIYYETDNNDTTPPETRIRFSGQSTADGSTYYITPETQIYFTSEDESPVSIEYDLDGAGFRPALPFTIDTPGTYPIDFFATDESGNVESTKSATLILPGAGTEVAVTSDESGIFPSDLLSIRPNRTPIRAAVPPSSLDVHGTLTILRGVLAYPRLSGIPVDPTPRDTAMLAVGGRFVDFYKYRVNGGSWSAESPVADPIALDSLSGAVTVEVLGRHASGDYLPDEEALAVSWTVDPTAEDLTVTGVPATPSAGAADVTLDVDSPDSGQYRWALGEGGFFRAAEPYTTPIELTRQPVGDRTIRLITDRGGDFPEVPDPDPVARVRWSYDPAYGFAFDRLEEIRAIDLGEVSGQSIDFVWDGKDDAGVEQIPGPYTVFLALEDSLGNVSRSATLVEIEGLSSDRQIIADPAVGPKNFRARGDWAVWQQRTGSVSNIHAYRLNGVSATAVTASADFDQENPATDGRHVVWQSRLANGSTDLFHAELESPAPQALTDTPGLIEANPAVEWPWFVYQVKSADSPFAPWQIEATNADTAERFLVSPGQGDQFRPRIHGGRIVWEDHRDVGPGEIYFADLETREVRRITNNTFGQNNPTIHGDLIAWQDNRAGQVDIWMRDLRRRIEEQVTDTAYNESNPRFHGAWLCFEEDSLGPQHTNIVLHDIDAGSRISLTRATRRHVLAGLGKGFGAWIEEVDGRRSAVISRLPGLQAVTETSNALAVSDGLAMRHGSAFELLEAWGGPGGIRKVSLYQSLDPLVVQTADYNGGSPDGTDFALTPGSFLWVEFDAANLVELGVGASGSIELETGFNVFSYTGFPVGFTAYDLVNAVGPAKLGGLRLYDAFAGVWRSLELDDAAQPLGPNFTIPRVATLLIDAKEAVSVNPNF
jgi:beta propeller repeat protein